MGGSGGAVQRIGLALAPIVGAAAVWRVWDAARFEMPGRMWAAPLGVVVCALCIVATPLLRGWAPWPGAVTFVYGGCLGAAYLCVPETDHIERIAPWFVVITVIEVASRRSLPVWLQWIGAPVVVGAGLFGATGRQSALVGGLFALWPVLLVAVVGLRHPDVVGLRAWRRVAVVATGGFASFVVSRTGALQPTVAPAVVAVALAAPVSLYAADRLVRTSAPVNGPIEATA